jgi:NADH-quinone oxidoreductase subunit J
MLITLAGAAGAMALRNLVHCALCLVLAFGGLAALYLQLGAEFIGFAQVLVYVGAVAVLIVFAILLTRNSETRVERLSAASVPLGLGIAVLVAGALGGAAWFSGFAPAAAAARPVAGVRSIGERLMTQYVLPLEVLGLLLTAALIGAVIIALKEPGEPG